MSGKKIFILGILAAAFLGSSIAAAGAESTGLPVLNAARAAGDEEENPLLPFLELRTLKLGTRYSYVANDTGISSRNQQQHKEAVSLRFRFDSEGKYSLNAVAGSGSGFTSGWDDLGIGSDAKSKFRVRELFLSLKPWKGLELQYGGISVVRGPSTEITTYDGDSYLMGARLTIKKPQQFFFDEITGTLAYLGDLSEPNVFRRMDRFDASNYHQILVSKKIGKRATVSGEYASHSGLATLRQAVQVKVPELKAIDTVRFENYQRVEGIKDFGFAIQADRKIHEKFSVGGGYADIDRYYGGLNADRFNKGKRIFAIAKIDIIRSLDVEVFVQQAVANNYSISNDVRLDLVLTYNLLPGIRKLGLFRIPQ